MTFDTTDATNWYLEQLKPLVGGTIIGLAEADEGFYGLDIRMKDGERKVLILLSDDEGNAPGSFEILADPV